MHISRVTTRFASLVPNSSNIDTFVEILDREPLLIIKEESAHYYFCDVCNVLHWVWDPTMPHLYGTPLHAVIPDLPADGWYEVTEAAFVEATL